ncbi:hypothetical protein, partial [uncultured Psychrobacter sp.]|uniref:hypothetical protein n=1 Tax=uncultured Psychrobacter sp. TaxID=259303 RepID=UPI002639D073
SGYFRIRKFIQQTPKIRILVGINVDKLTYQANSFSASPTATSQTLGQSLQVTFASIAANTTANVIFAAQPSKTGTN